MKAEVSNGALHISIPMQEPTPSASGKTLIIASTSGPSRTTATLPDGRQITINLNAWVRP